MQKLLLSLLTAASMSLGICAMSGQGMAQTNAAPSRAGSRLITLGTIAGPPPRSQRAQCSNLLTVNGMHYVIDAGDGVVRRLAESGINVRDIGTIFISHHHDDHTAGLGTLMSVAWDQNRTQPINAYGPPGTEALVKAAVQYFTLSSEIRIADGGRPVPIARVFFGHDVGTGLIYQDANIKVRAIENTHFDFHKGGPHAGKFKSYSYRFETPDRVIVFTGDTGPSDKLTEFAKDADLLLSEVNSIDDRKQVMINDGQWQVMSEQERAGILQQAAQGHLTPEVIGQMASRANVKTVVLTHLTYRPPPNTENYAPWANEVKKQFSGRVLIASDLMEF
jgi:ribonuclease BN (tRNA processing enzyme)